MYRLRHLSMENNIDLTGIYSIELVRATVFKLYNNLLLSPSRYVEVEYLGRETNLQRESAIVPHTCRWIGGFPIEVFLPVCKKSHDSWYMASLENLSGQGAAERRGGGEGEFLIEVFLPSVSLEQVGMSVGPTGGIEVPSHWRATAQVRSRQQAI